MFPIFEWLKARAKASEAQSVLQSLFGLSLDEAQQCYGTAFADPLQMPDREYPELRNLRGWNLRAVSCMFQTDNAYAGEVISRAVRNFRRVSEHFYHGKTDKFFINISISQEFAGSTITLLTNDLSLFDRIEEGHYSPPPPWIVFPEYDPETLGSLQGDIDYWWYTYWSPFWRRMPASQQAQYLKDHGATDAWAECIRCH